MAGEKSRNMKNKPGLDPGESTSSSEDDNELDDDMAWREGLALEEIPDASEFKERRQRHSDKNSAAIRKNKIEEAKADLMQEGSPTKPSNDGNEPPGQVETGQPARPTGHGGEAPPEDAPDPRADKRVQTTIAWVRKFTPGHYESRTQVPDVVQVVRLHYNSAPDRKQWFAKYEVVDGATKAKLPKHLKQQSHTKKASLIKTDGLNTKPLKMH